MSPEQLIASINTAFADVPRPPKHLLTSCECSECTEIRDDFDGKQPEELDPDRMRYHSWDMGFFTADARQFFLPGWMRLAINNPHLAYADAAIQLLWYSEGWDSQMGYSQSQQQTVAEFLDFLSRNNYAGLDREFQMVRKKWSSYPIIHSNPKSDPDRLP